ncbi:hypothetical protein HMPREF3201_00230, partial [Megasphaera sp. MJR8396C]
MAVAHDLADAADKVDIPAIISEPGVVESTTVAVVLPISISKGVRAAKIGEDSSLMNRAAVAAGHDKVFAQFKAVAVTGVGVAVLMGIGRA